MTEAPRAEDVNGLPERAVTRLGSVYDPRPDAWIIREHDSNWIFSFDDLGASQLLVAYFKQYSLKQIGSGSIRSAKISFKHLRSFFRSIMATSRSVSEITEADLIAYRESLPTEKLFRSSQVHSELRRWAKLGVPGISPKALEFAREAKRHQVRKAEAVDLRCLKHGALSNIEYESLYAALHDAFQRNEIRLETYVLCVLNGAFGQRPEQWSWLQVQDVRKITGENAKVSVVLSIPRVKQGSDRPRDQMTERPLDPELALLVLAQAERVRTCAMETNLLHPEMAPLFPLVDRWADPIPATVPRRADHQAIAQRIRKTLNGLGVKSERTGETLLVNARRSRRTVGTRAAIAGKSLEHIAALLDHTRADSARVYIELGSEMVASLDKKLGFEMAVLAQAFKGALVSESDRSKVRRRVFGVTIEGQAPVDLGGCGKSGFCHLSKPVSCYTCRLFQPWDDGPHEAVLDGLLAHRERVATVGSPVVAMSLDRTIAACAEVVRRCRAQLNRLEEAADD